MADDFTRAIEQNADSFGSVPFWSWNDRLDPDRLRQQIRRMHELKMRGFFMHARGGLETEYMGEEWFSCVAACAEEAEKLGMEAWLYDENGWPSGFAGGALLKDPANYALYLTMETRKEPDAAAMCTYVREGGGIRQIDSGTAAPGVGEYYCVYRQACDSYVDTMDRRVTEKFIAATHEEYKKRFGSLFGKVIPGFFTDEPQYYRWATAWSDTFPQAFREAYGYEVYSGLAALFLEYEGAEEFRYDYWLLCHRQFIENFARPIYEWAEANGCQITGHTIEETTLSGQMWCTGGVMPFYRYEHIPGIDHLCRGLGSDLSPKQVASAAAQLGRKYVLSEMFAACGWDVTPLELKNIAQWQYASGINRMCQHLYPYSLRGQRKTDYPCHYSEHLPWQDALKEFNEYFNRLGAALSLGTERVRVLVIHPMHSAYLHYRREEDTASVAELEDGCSRMIRALSEQHILYHLGDETLMAEFGSVSDGRLHVGKCSYDTVLLPLCETLDSSTARLLKDFLSQGGRLAAWEPDRLPTRIDGRAADMRWLTPNLTFEELRRASGISVRESDGRAAASIRVRVMDRPDGTTYYLVNLDQEAHRGITAELGEDGPILYYDPQSGHSGQFSEKGTLLTLDFEAAQGFVLYTERRERPQNVLPLDMASVQYEQGPPSALRPVAQIRDLTLKRQFAGRMTMCFPFFVRELPQGRIRLAAEPLTDAILRVNGQTVVPGEDWWLDRSFRTADITDAVRAGENTVSLSFRYFQKQQVYDVLTQQGMESRRNCLSFDTEIENIYLIGDFGVYTDPSLFRPGENGSEVYTGTFSVGMAPPAPDARAFEDVVRCGYPFYAGELTADCSLTVPSEYRRLRLRLEGRYAYGDLYVNGQFAQRLLFTRSCDITALARPGRNQIRVVLCNSARNLLGPHHFREEEPYVVGPDVFTAEGCWEEDGCSAYRGSYSFMPFGAKIELEVE